jgi:signal transduction histidine kinase
MTINDMHPTELIEHRLRQARADRNKVKSDLKDIIDSASVAVAETRNILDELEMKRLLAADDISEFEEMGKDYE